jgi:zinc and cadmium transporter
MLGASDIAATVSSPRPLIVAGVYCVAVILASLAGGWLPLVVRLTHTRLQLGMSLCGGLMLGIGLLHLLPHSFALLGSIDASVLWMLAGLLFMFFMIRAFHFHQHEPADPKALLGGEYQHDDDARRSHSHQHAQGHRHPAERLNWVGVVLGLGVHSIIDGVALAASVQADAGHGEGWLFGFGTFLAILLHKPLDTMPISILMTAGGSSTRRRHVVNGAFAALCPLGVVLFFLGLQRFTPQQEAIVGSALAFSAGVFMCISLSDLLPELEFHAHDRFKLSLALLIGVALAYGIGYLEPAGAHGHEGPARHEHGHGHEH